MSKSILGAVLAVVGVVLIATGVGAPLGTIALGAGLGSISVAAVIGIGLELASTLLLGPGKPKMPETSPLDRLYATLVPTAPRKWCFGGTTALATDVRYQTFKGDNQEEYWQVVALASHEVHSIDEIWLDAEKAWDSTGPKGRYSGYFFVTARTLGTSGNGVAIDSTWTSHATLTGCAYLVLQFKLTGNSDDVQSPFAGGVTNRITVRGKGAKVYDPRLDNTVTGGAGPHRADDQSTWAWDDNASRNPALQLLFFLLGWKINGKLALGMGLPPARIDLPSFITAANLCDESVALAAGGTEPRYRCDGVLGENEDRQAVIEALCAQMNATMRDAGGKLALSVIHNDLSAPVASFTETDIIEGGKWAQTLPLSQSFNIERGRRIDPSDAGLYQPTDFPEISLASPDGIDRIDSIDYDFVQSNGQAQRLAKQRLQRNQYQGRYSFIGGERWWQVNIGDVVSLSHQSYGWSNKLFRMVEQAIDPTGPVKITLLEENAAIYQWDNDERPAVVPGTPTIYDPLNAPLLRPINPIGDSNRVHFSLMERGTQGYGIYDPTASAIAALSTGTTGGRNWIKTSGTFTADGQECSIGTDGPTNSNYRIRVTPGERLWASAMVGASMPAVGCTRFLGMYFYDSTNTLISSSNVSTAAGSDTFPVQRGGFCIVPLNAVWGQLRQHVTNNSLGITGAFSIQMAEPMVCSASNTQTAAPPFTPGPSNLTIDSATSVVIDPIPDVIIYADSNGVVKTGELPRDVPITASIGTAAVTALGTWTRTTVSGITDTIGAATGILNITALTAPEVRVPIEFDYAGVTRTALVHVVRKDDPPTTAGGGSGGGGGTTGTSASTTTLGQTTGTAYDTLNSVSAILTATAGSGGFVDLTAPISFKRNSTSGGETGAAGKWQWRVIGGTFADVTTEALSVSDAITTPASGGDPMFNDIGVMPNSTVTKSGLTGGTSYEFRFLWRQVNVSGTASNVFRLSGTLTAAGR